MAAAQEVLADIAPAELPTDTPAVLPAPVSVAIPRMTPVVVELLATLSSETSTNGDHFALRLAEPIVIDGVTVVPAGTPGEGEVIHAKRKGGMGAAGELILTARFLQLDGQQIPLRSMRVGGAADSRIDTVNSIGMASAATLPLVALVGFFIEGGALTVAEGSRASARTAQDIMVELPQLETVVEEPESDAAPVETTLDQQDNNGSNLEGEPE